MLTLHTEFDDVWQNDFVILMDNLSKIGKSPPPSVGETSKELIYSENKLRLFRYFPLDVKQKKTPLLITYALVNRPFIVDLEPKRSLILRLLEQGQPVYLIDWGYPDSSDCFTSLNDYINGYMERCIQRIKRKTTRTRIDLMGICQGGVFSLCYTALHPKNIRKLVTLVTPIDFHTKDNSLGLWTHGIHNHTLSGPSANVPGELIAQLFKTLKPFLLNRDKYRKIKHLVSKKENLDTFLRMEKWLNNGPDLAGLAAGEFLADFYQQNRLHNNTLSINGESVCLKKISCPVFNLYATQDHIVPPDSARALCQHIKAKLYEEAPLNGGHIGAFISPKTQRTLVSKLMNWLD